MSNYATKSEVEKAAGADASEFAKKADLASSKSDVDKLNIDRLKTVPTVLSKLSHVVDNDVVEKTVYDEFAWVS